MTDVVISLENVSRVYSLPGGDVVALDHLSLEIKAGEFIAIMGPSGSGKSTLLNQIGCLDVPTEGTLKVAGRNVAEMDDDELTDLRRDSIGYIFQKFQLIPLLNAYENVEYPLILKNKKRDTSGRPEAMLEKVGISEQHMWHKPNELSGGQQQRVAIARALINDPAILLCDEPTGNLDSKTSTQIMEILKDLHQQGKTIIMVTHDPETAKYAERSVTIADGRIQ